MGFAIDMMRDRFILEFGFAVPTPDLVARLAASGPILEVGAGLGYLARLISDAGGDILATDAAPNFMATTSARAWSDIHTIDAESAVQKFPARTLLASWPSLGEDWLTRATLLLPAGTRIVMIGEGRGGCTGSASFYELIGREILPDPDFLEGADVWRFPRIHDTAQAFRRQ